MGSHCGSGPSGVLCQIENFPSSSVGSAISSGTQSVLHGVAESMASAAGGLLKTLSSFWMQAGTPQLAGSGSPVAVIQRDVQWIVAAVAVVSVLAAAGKMAIRRRGEPAAVMALGLARLVVVSAAATTLVELAGKAGDTFSADLMSSAHVGSHGWAGIISTGAISAAFAPGDGMMLIVSLVIIFSALIQLLLMVLRTGLLIILTGTLPLAAAASMSEWGETWWRRHLGWLAAWLVYKPAAALLFASATALTRGRRSLLEVAAGFMLLILSVLILPALLRVIVPVTASLGAASAGSLAMGAAGAAATGAIRFGGAGGIRPLLARRPGNTSSGDPAAAIEDAPDGAGTTLTESPAKATAAEGAGEVGSPAGAPASDTERTVDDSAASAVSSDNAGAAGSLSGAESGTTPPASAGRGGPRASQAGPPPGADAGEATAGPDGSPTTADPEPGTARPGDPSSSAEENGAGPSGAIGSGDDTPAGNGG